MHALRCSLHFRKPDSIARSWALLIAAYVLFVPGNLLPVMETGSLFGSETDTIMSGVVFLWISGLVAARGDHIHREHRGPGGEALALTYLLVSVQCRSTWAPLQRTRLYRAVELVGRWSMVDIYVAASSPRSSSSGG